MLWHTLALVYSYKKVKSRNHFFCNAFITPSMSNFNV